MCLCVEGGGITPLFSQSLRLSKSPAQRSLTKESLWMVFQLSLNYCFGFVRNVIYKVKAVALSQCRWTKCRGICV